MLWTDQHIFLCYRIYKNVYKKYIKINKYDKIIIGVKVCIEEIIQKIFSYVLS